MPDAEKRFSLEETAAIRAALHAPNAAMVCPRCGGALTVEYPVGTASMGHYWEVRCSGCATATYVSDVPRGRRPTPPGSQP